MINILLKRAWNRGIYSSSVNLSFNHDEHGIIKCNLPKKVKLDPNLKLKIEQLVHKVIQNLPTQEVDNLDLIKIDKVKHSNNIDSYSVEAEANQAIINLNQSDEILELAKLIFADSTAKKLEHFHIHLPKIPAQTSSLPLEAAATPLEDKQIAHILAGEFGAKSQLEGNYPIDNLKFIEKFIIDRITPQGRLPYGISEQLLKNISQGILYSISMQDPQEITQAISSAITSNQPLLMDGGWIGFPEGHCIFYELIPQPNGKSTLRLYNLGAGIESFSSIIVGSKKKANPIVEWRDIANEKLLNTTFSQVLHELSHQIRTPNGANTNYSAKDIYFSLKEMLMPTSEAFISDTAGAMTKQRGGFCSWKSLIIYLKIKMDDKNYKIFKCDMKLSALSDNYSSMGSSLTKTAHFRFVQKSLASVCRNVDKLYESGVVGKEYVERAYQLLAPVKQWVHTHKTTVLEHEPPVDVQMLQLTPLDQISITSKWKGGKVLKTPQPLLAGQAPAVTTSKTHYVNDLLDKIRAIPATPMEDLFNKAIPLIMKAWTNQQDLECHMALNHIIGQFPIEKEFWKTDVNNDPSQAQIRICQLSQLQALYLKTCWMVPKAEIIAPERVLHTYKILYIQSHLAEIVMPGKWKEMKPCGSDFAQFQDATFGSKVMFHFHFFSSVQNEEFQEISRWFREVSKHPINTLGINTSEEGALRNCISFKAPETYIDYLAQHDPTLIPKITKNTPGFGTLSKQERDTLVLMSPDLPDWFNGLLSSYFLASTLSENSISSPQAIDREEDLKLIKHYDSKTNTIFFFLSGVKIPSYTSTQYEHYPKFKSNKMNELTSGLVEWEAATTERFLVAEKGLSVHSLTLTKIEEFKELAYVNLDPNVCVLSTLALFQRNPSYLFDPDYQLFFEMVVFQPGYFQHALKLSGFSDILLKFIEDGFQKCRNDNQIQTAVFLARMTRLFQGLAPNLQLEKYQLPLLRKLLEQKPLDADLKALIYIEIAASLSRKEKLTDQDIEDTLVGSILLHHQPPPENWINEYINQDILNNLYLHATQLKNALLPNSIPNQKLLNTLLKQLKPKEKDTEWKVTYLPGEFPQFESVDGNYTYYPLNASFVFPGVTTRIPHSITQNERFKRLFPDVKQGKLLAHNLFSFKDPIKGYETRISKKDDVLIIEQLRGKKQLQWHRYIPHEALSFDSYKNTHSPLYSQYFAEGHLQAWMPLNNSQSIILVDPATNSKKYSCFFEEQSNNWEIKKIINYPSLQSMGIPSPLMDSIEEPQYIHEWYKEDQLYEINLPRYQLNFLIDSSDPSKLNCQEIPGYFLKSNEVLKKLGSYRHYLVLEDKHGNKKAFLPIHQFTSLPHAKREVFEPRYEIDMETNCSPRKQHYYLFEVLKNGKLFSKSREANLYLAEVFLLVQDYKQAAALLKQYGTKLRAYTPKEIEFLQKIANIHTVTGNIEGDAIGIEMYAAYLLEKNFSDFPKEEDLLETSLQIKISLQENYDLYLDHLNTITVLKLTKEEELYVTRKLDKNLANIHRKQTLMGAITANALVPPTQVINAFSIGVPLDFTSVNASEYSPWSYPKTFDIKNVTVMQTDLQSSNIAGVYNLLHQVSDPLQISQFNAGLIFWKNNALTENDQLKVEFLKLVLNHQSAFPEIPPDLNKDNFDGWWKQVIAIANQLSKQYPPLSINKAPRKELEGGLGRVIQNPSITKIDLGGLKVEEVPPFQPKITTWFTASEQKTISVKTKEGLQKSLGELIKLTTNQQKKPNKLVKNEVERLQNDINIYSTQPKPPHYRLDDNALAEIENYYAEFVSSTAKDSHQVIRKALKKEILTLANQSPLPPFGKARKNLLAWGGKQKPLKIEELIFNFAKQDPTALKMRNPALFPVDIQKLYTKIGKYLQLEVQKQQAERILKHVENLKKLYKLPGVDPGSVEGVVQLLAAEIIAARCYHIQDNPAALVLEYNLKVLLRPQQVKMVDDFLQNKNVEALRELIMGSGKSKIIMPLLGYLKADGTNLSTIIVPEALYHNVASDTAEILRDVYNLNLHTLDFNRNTEFTIATLENILAELKSIRDNKECLILTSKTLNCLLLKFIEQSVEHFSESGAKPLTPELELMKKILHMLSTESTPLLDEADLLLNVLHEVSFSLGKQNPPIQQEIDLIADLYTILYTNPEIKKLARLESDPTGIPDAPLLTEKLYQANIKHPLAEALIEHLKTKEYDNKVEQQAINTFFRGLKDEEKKVALHYLCRTKEKESEAQSFYDKQPLEIKKILALAGEEISNLLSHCLLSTCNERYGTDDEVGGLLAIPFSAANTPSRGSEFANHHITINYTIQNYIQKKIPRQILVAQIHLLQEQARREIIEHQGTKTLQDTQAWRLFHEIAKGLSLPFFNLSEKQIDLLLELVNNNTVLRLKMVQNLILPQIVIFDKKLSSNSHNLASFSKNSGFTGSLWNIASLHRKLTSIRTEGTDAHTLTTLWDNSFEAVHTGFKESTSEILTELKDRGVQFDLFADAGGYFKDLNNLDNAKLLSEHLHKPIAFYNDRGDQVIWEKKGSTLLSESPLKSEEEQRATFLDQAHTTGADITQKPQAIGLVTIGAGMLLRDLLQAVWRLRGLDKSQRVGFIISKDVETLMRQILRKQASDKITFADVLGFVVLNQAERQGKDNAKAFSAELDEVSQKVFLDVMLNPKSTAVECAKAVQELSSSWIKASFASADQLYGQLPIEGDSDKISSLIIDSYLDKIKDSSLTANKENEIQQIASHFEGRLPPIMSTKARNIDLTTEREVQKVAKKQSELEVLTSNKKQAVNFGEIFEDDQLKESYPDKFSADLYPLRQRTVPSEKVLALWSNPGKFPLPIFPIKTYFEEYQELAQYASLFDGIKLSLNMLQIPDKKEIETSEIAFFGRNRKHIHYVQLENSQLTLLNNTEANRRIKLGRENIYELTLGFVNSTKKPSPQELELVIKTKFLSGECHYTAEELKFLRDWFLQQGVNKMYDLFNQHVLEGLLLKTREYNQSSLQLLFHELMRT